MKINGKVFMLEDIKGMIPSVVGIEYVDCKDTHVFIPIAVLIRLYETTKFVLERDGVDWEQFTNALFEKPQD